MSNIYLAHPELSDAAAISGSNALGDMAITNLQKKSLSRVYRTNELTANIDIDFGAPQSINFCALVKHNGTSGGTVRVRAGSSVDVLDYDSGALPMITGTDLGYDYAHFATAFEAQSYQYWRLEFIDSSNPDGYLQIGRLYLSNAFTPQHNVSYGFEEGFIDPTEDKRTLSGEKITLDRDPIRVTQFQMDFLSEDEAYDHLYELDRLRGNKKDVILVPDMDETKHFQRKFLYGHFREMTAINKRAFKLHRKRYKIEEI